MNPTPETVPEARRLNIGCGLDLRAGWVNLDTVDYGGNTVCDLNRHPWPFPDNHFDEVLASHILEHLANFNATVTEIWRVCRPDALVVVRVPFFLSTKYYSEPDHRIPFGIRSFDNYEDFSGRSLRFYERWKLGHRTNYGSPARFRVEDKRFHFSNFALLRWLNVPINLEPVIYERFFATWFTPEEVWFRLRASKGGESMILPQLIWRFARHRDDEEFYRIQARDAIRWMLECGTPLGANTSVLDLGCGHGIFGGLLKERGCRVTFADAENGLTAEYRNERFLRVNLDNDPLDALGRYDLVVCSNVLEHLSAPQRLLQGAHDLLEPEGCFYLSWTNWLSPWGGHEFSPLHYLGSHLGPRLYDILVRRPRFHKPHVNLFPTYIGTVMRTLRSTTTLRVMKMAPRYYTGCEWIMRVPVVREFLAWNCALLLRRIPEERAERPGVRRPSAVVARNDAEPHRGG